MNPKSAKSVAVSRCVLDSTLLFEVKHALRDLDVFLNRVGSQVASLELKNRPAESFSIEAETPEGYVNDVPEV